MLDHECDSNFVFYHWNIYRNCCIGVPTNASNQLSCGMICYLLWDFYLYFLIAGGKFNLISLVAEENVCLKKKTERKYFFGVTRKFRVRIFCDVQLKKNWFEGLNLLIYIILLIYEEQINRAGNWKFGCKHLFFRTFSVDASLCHT